MSKPSMIQASENEKDSVSQELCEFVIARNIIDAKFLNPYSTIHDTSIKTLA